jgi:hypothetical protein
MYLSSPQAFGLEVEVVQGLPHGILHLRDADPPIAVLPRNHKAQPPGKRGGLREDEREGDSAHAPGGGHRVPPLDLVHAVDIHWGRRRRRRCLLNRCCLLNRRCCLLSRRCLLNWRCLFNRCWLLSRRLLSRRVLLVLLNSSTRRGVMVVALPLRKLDQAPLWSC